MIFYQIAAVISLADNFVTRRKIYNDVSPIEGVADRRRERHPEVLAKLAGNFKLRIRFIAD